MDRAAVEANEPSDSLLVGWENLRIVLSLLLNRQHAVERDLRPVLLILGHDDAVVHLAVDETFENPQQVIRRHAEHRRAETTELIEREHRALGAHLLRETIDEMDLGANSPH